VNAASFLGEIRSRLSFSTLFWCIVLIAFFVRFWALDLTLYHHDEAVHGWFSYRLFQEGAYEYDPSYHGPFLYYATAGMFTLFGDSDLVGRILPAAFGLSLLPMVYAIHRLGYLDKRQTLIAGLFLALSPELVYFSRFLRHDMFQLAFTLLVLVALLYYHSSGKLRYAALAGLSAGLGMCCKEDMPILLLIFGIYGLYLLLARKITLPTTWKRDAAISLLFLVGTMLLLYSSFGVHPEVIVGRTLDLPYVQENGILPAINTTGWYKAVEHWAAMHGQCRICGPWFFYGILLLLYELPIVAFAVVGGVQFFMVGRRFSLPWRDQEKEPEPSVAELVKRCQAKKDRDAGKREEFMRFSLFWLLLTLAAYAYIGEKVPWLVIHQLLPLIFVAAYRMTNKKMFIAVATSVILILCLWHVSFVPTDVNEPIVQVQNSEDLRIVMDLIDASDKVVIASKNYWPLPWYYRGERAEKLQYYGYLLEERTLLATNADMIITYDAESYESLPGYAKRTYKNNYWFSFYDNQDRLIPYYFLRDGKMGSMNFDIFLKISS
jgi:uncharacterized protein (TIGR03663 family)